MTFKSDMQRISRKINATMSETAFAVKFSIFKGVVKGTRVDTGRARANWTVTQDQPFDAQLELFDKSGSSTISTGGSRIEPIALTYFTNNVPYIRKLEALDGMAVRNVARVRQIIRSV